MHSDPKRQKKKQKTKTKKPRVRIRRPGDTVLQSGFHFSLTWFLAVSLFMGEHTVSLVPLYCRIIVLHFQYQLSLIIYYKKDFPKNKITLGANLCRALSVNRLVIIFY